MTLEKLYKSHTGFLQAKSTNYILPGFRYVRSTLSRLKLTQQDREDIQAGYPPSRMTVNVYDEQLEHTAYFRIHKYPYQQRMFIVLAAKGYLSRQGIKCLVNEFFKLPNPKDSS